MTMRTRLARLEARRQGPPHVPCVIVFTSCHPDTAGIPQTRAEFAFVQSVSGWQTIARDEGETDATFRTRVEAMAA